MQYVKLEDTVFFFFGVNDTSGSGDNGASPLFSVREAGAAAGAAAMFTGTPTLLTGTNHTPGSYEIAIAATTGNGFAADKTYAVYATILVDAQNPTGHIGIFKIQPIPASVIDMGANSITASAIQNAAITAAKFATDAIDANALAADAVTAIQAGLSTFVAATDDVKLAATGLDNINVDTMSMPIAMEIIAAAVSGDLSGAGSGTETFLGLDNAATRMISTVDASGNRTVTYPP